MAGASSHRRSFRGSGAVRCAAGKKGDAEVVRIDGGTKEGGRVDGISFPANFFWIRYMATANPSRVKRPSLLISARSLMNLMRFDESRTKR